MSVEEVNFKKNIDDPDFVLDAAKGKLETVVIIGRQSNGELYLAGSTDSVPLANLMIDHAKLALLEAGE